MNLRTLSWIIALLTLAGPGAALAQSGGDYDLSWSTIDGGGVIYATGGDFELAGTIGQPDASPASMFGGEYLLVGGFWALTPRCTDYASPDFDHDCDVDSADFAVFAGCAMGAEVGYDPLPGGCTLPLVSGYIAADFDTDGDVDADDFARFQRCYSGNQPADPWCDDE